MTSSFFGIAERNHFAEVIRVVAHKAHRLRDIAHLDFAERALAHAHQLQEVRRSKAGALAEFAPRERTKTLAFIVVILHKEVIIFVFKYRFHTKEYIFFSSPSQ